MYKIYNNNSNNNNSNNNNSNNNNSNNKSNNTNNYTNTNYYYDNKNNNLQYGQQKSVIDDISKMHLIPPHCPMTPHSFTDFFNDNKKLHGVAPYHLNIKNDIVKHKKDGKPNVRLQYNNFYSDFKKDALKYNSPVMAEYEEDIRQPIINKLVVNDNHKNHNVKIFQETKNKKGFAVPMKSNGSNKLETIYNGCLNIPTFEYKPFATHNQKNRIDNTNKFNNMVDNPLFNIDISEETNNLYNDYMDSIDQNASDIYQTVFEDMYILGYNPVELND
jgi:hypothetical protein